MFNKWFYTRGFKSYGFAVLIILVIDIAFGFGYSSILESSIGEDVFHYIMLALGHFTLLGANIGIFVHMYQTYSKWVVRENKKLK